MDVKSWMFYFWLLQWFTYRMGGKWKVKKTNTSMSAAQMPPFKASCAPLFTVWSPAKVIHYMKYINYSLYSWTMTVHCACAPEKGCAVSCFRHTSTPTLLLFYSSLLGINMNYLCCNLIKVYFIAPLWPLLGSFLSQPHHPISKSYFYLTELSIT